MKYWAVARCLGLTDYEFDMSTLAKITALYQVKVLTWDRNRDYFVCQLAAMEMNGRRTEEGQKVWTADELLAQIYPAQPTHKGKDTVIITPDLDRGVPGNWKGTKEMLKGVTANRERKNKKRKVFNA